MIRPLAQEHHGRVVKSTGDGVLAEFPSALDAVAAIEGACPHLYGKLEARPGRKMGHVTILGTSLQDALARAAQVCAALGLEPVR